MSEFFVSLQSNASMDVFPSNTIGNFKNKLSNTIRLTPDNWEVALVDCSYVYGHVIIKKQELLGAIVYSSYDEKTHMISINQTEFYSSDDIRSIKELVEMLPKILPVTCSIKNHLTTLVCTDKAVFSINFYSKLSAILGLKSHYVKMLKSEPMLAEETDWLNTYNELCPFTDMSFKFIPNDVIETKNYLNVLHANVLEIVGDQVCFPNAGNTKLFMYCNIVEAQYIADVQAKCLRILPYKGDYGEITYQSFAPPHFLNVSVSDFDFIHIWILTETGDAVNFDFPSFSVTLKFREKRLLK